MKHYERLTGNQLTCDYAGYPFANSPTDVSNVINYASNRVFTRVLNSLDFLTFSLDLYDPMAYIIKRKTSVVKLWRDVNDTKFSKTYTAPTGTPDFSGVCVATKKNGASKTMDFTFMNPLWLLQCHFHILNHHLVLDVTPADPHLQGGNNDGAAWDISALMWYLIDLVDHAFGAASRTGILKPTSGPPYWTKTITVAPYFVAKGSNTWANLFDDLQQRVGGPDLDPQYVHSSGNPWLMYFATAPALGADRSASVSFDFHTGNHNCDDMVEDAQLVPGKFGNYVWAVPDGGPNVYVAVDSDATDYGDEGLFMVYDEIPGAKKATVDNVVGAHLDKALHGDEPIFSAQLSPTVPPYYNVDYFLGDVVELNADRGAMQLANVKQRIVQVQLSMSDNNVETAAVTLAPSYQGKVAATTTT